MSTVKSVSVNCSTRARHLATADHDPLRAAPPRSRNTKVFTVQPPHSAAVLADLVVSHRAARSVLDIRVMP
jgi:hypothetical protein